MFLPKKRLPYAQEVRIMAVKQLNQTKLERKDLMGFFTHPGTEKDYFDLIKMSISSGSVSTIYYHNLHTIYLYLTSDEYRQSFSDKTVIVDGMGALFLYKLAGFSLSRDYRLTYVDFIMPMLEMARDNDWRVFHIGQEEQVQQQALATIRQRVPEIEIDGCHGYFDFTQGSQESVDVIRQVNEFSADLLLVGLGSPIQELWVDAQRDKMNSPVVMVCGSCMEYVAGNVKTAPRWMGRAGIEMLFRLYADPKRLAFRYLVEPFLLGFILLRNRFQGRTGSSTEQ